MSSLGVGQCAQAWVIRGALPQRLEEQSPQPRGPLHIQCPQMTPLGLRCVSAVNRCSQERHRLSEFIFLWCLLVSELESPTAWAALNSAL